MTSPLLLSMALLVAVVLGLILWPLWRSTGKAADVSRTELNAAVYRDQLKELERDRASGTLSEPAFAQSAQELQHRVLADVGAETPAVATTRTPKQLILGIAFLIPLAGALLYAMLGDPGAAREQQAPTISARQIDDMVGELAARLKKNPDDPKGWIMLARSYRALGRFELAAEAFEHVGPSLEQDASLLADYAEVLARSANGDFDGKPQAALDKAIALAPANPQVLTLAGIAAYQRRQYAEAADDWEHTLASLPPDSEQAKVVAATIVKARALAQADGTTPAVKPGAKPAAAKAAAGGRAVGGRVALAPAFASQVKPGDTLFIFARAVDGPRMPLAVLRTTAKSLPLDFTLDDAQAMSPQFNLSSLAPDTKVLVEARISASGEALPKPGDLIGDSGPVKPGAKGLKITIERVVR
jgi:cytochrome c-type biogenesis protein CcmH